MIWVSEVLIHCIAKTVLIPVIEFLLAVLLLVIDFTNGRNSIVWKDDKNPEQQKECSIHHFWETMYPYH